MGTRSSWGSLRADARPFAKPDITTMITRKIACLITVAGLLAVSGCGGGSGANPGAAELEKAFPPSARAGADSQSTPTQSHASAAVTAIKAGDYPKAMDELEALRKQPALTPDQYMALNKVSGEVMQKLASLAEKGDAKAKASLEHLKQERDRR